MEKGWSGDSRALFPDESLPCCIDGPYLLQNRKSPTGPATSVSSWMASKLTRRAGTATLIAASMGLFAACASYEVKDAAPGKLEAMPHAGAEGMLSIGADPHVQADRQEQIFAAGLAEAAVLPIQVIVSNRGDRSVQIEPENFKLSLPDKQMIAPSPGSEVAQLFAPKEGITDHVLIGAGMLGGFGGPIGAAAGQLIALLSYGVLGRSRADATEARQDDYIRKQLKSTRLGKNQLTQGFLFFVLPKETPPFDQATLTLSVLENQTETATVRVNLKGLGHRGKAATD